MTFLPFSRVSLRFTLLAPFCAVVILFSGADKAQAWYFPQQAYWQAHSWKYYPVNSPSFFYTTPSPYYYGSAQAQRQAYTRPPISAATRNQASTRPPISSATRNQAYGTPRTLQQTPGFENFVTFRQVGNRIRSAFRTGTAFFKNQNYPASWRAQANDQAFGTGNALDAVPVGQRTLQPTYTADQQAQMAAQAYGTNTALGEAPVGQRTLQPTYTAEQQAQIAAQVSGATAALGEAPAGQRVLQPTYTAEQQAQIAAQVSLANSSLAVSQGQRSYLPQFTAAQQAQMNEQAYGAF